jgi:hypothetical protein
MSWLQLGQHWLQVELDELYRLHYLLSFAVFGILGGQGGTYWGK